MKALVLNRVLLHYKGYEPKVLEDAMQTTDYILSEATRLFPGYKIMRDDGEELGTLEEVEFSRNGINEWRLVCNRTEPYYPSEFPDIIMEYKHILDHKNNKLVYDVTLNCLQLMNSMCLCDVLDDGRMEYTDPECFFDPKGDFYPEIIKGDNDRIDRKLKKRLDAEKAIHFDIRMPLLEQIRQQADYNLLVKFSKKYNSQLSDWVAHLLMMHDAQFNMCHCINMMDPDYQNGIPVEPDSLIGLAFDREMVLYKYYWEDLKQYARESGIGYLCNTTYISEEGQLEIAGNFPIMEWVGKALSFNIQTLSYG